jgi:hypothetical protein
MISLTIYASFQWIAVLSVKGAAKPALSLPLKILRAAAISWLGICGMILSPLSTVEGIGSPTVFPIKGGINATMDAIKMISFGLISFASSLLSLGYGLKLFFALGGAKAMSSEASTDQEAKKRQSVIRILKSSGTLAVFLLGSFLYCFLSGVGRAPLCYLFYLPPSSYYYDISSCLLILGGAAVCFLIKLPPGCGQREAPKTGSTASTVDSGKHSVKPSSPSVVEVSTHDKKAKH